MEFPQYYQKVKQRSCVKILTSLSHNRWLWWMVTTSLLQSKAPYFWKDGWFKQCLTSHQSRNFQVMCKHGEGVSQGCDRFTVNTSVLKLLKLPSNLAFVQVGAPLLALPHPHLFVIPFKHDELVLQGLILTLQIHSGQVHLIQHPLQSSDVCLHSHPHGQLILIPDGTNGSERF